MDRKGFSDVFILVVVGLVLIVGVGGYFVWKNSTDDKSLIQTQNNILPQSPSAPIQTAENSTTVSTPTQASSTTVSSSPTSESSVMDQYNLFVLSDDYVQQCGGSVQVEYSNDGTVASGQYKGYNILLAGLPNCAPPGGDSAPVIFATKDYKTFILNGSSSDYDDSYNKTKVIGFGDIPLNAPPDDVSIGNFVLIRQPFADLNPISTSTIPLTSPVPGWTFYGFPSSITEGNNLYAGPTTIFAENASGTVYDYFVDSKENFNRQTDEGVPDEVYYESNEVTSTVPLYQNYSELNPGGCGGLQLSVLNISQSDIKEVGMTLNGVALYTPTDQNNQLNQDEFADKITPWTQETIAGTSTYIDGNVASIPSYSDYVAENPVLIFKDPFGRWVGLGEWDYSLIDGGCGKPVIYLYPPKPTEVSVKFTTPMRLTTDIPTYAADGWDVLAKPDGELTDLQPQFTPCAAIDSTAPGSEYAASACEHNDYPYLYWEGQASGQYPTPSGGWIVPQAGIADFLNQKLSAIGLTEKEKTDMTSYWVPELLAKNAPYYRMSFFQTAQMDQFIPMDVTPKPDTVIRVFLDWSPLAAMPAVPPQPEVLNHIDRKGFTLVEWGGLKQ